MKLIALFLLATACALPQREMADIKEFYNLDSLVNSQIEFIIDQNYSLEKNVRLNDERDDTVLHFGHEEWKNELKLFMEADINVPANSGMYSISRALEDPESNLLIDRYFPVENYNPIVQSLEIYYFRTIEQIKKVKIELNESNELYASSKQLELIFTNNSGKSRLSSYSITGIQKLVTRDSVTYEILGKIISN